MSEIKSNRVILLIHGFKRGNENDFEYLEESLLQFNLPVINFEYYDNYDKKTLSWKFFFKKISEQMEILKDKEIIIIGYSIGAIIGIYLENYYSNVIKVISIYPAFKIHFFDWIKKLKDFYFKRRRLKKKIGKERFKKLNEIAKKNKVVEKYPVKITRNINIFRSKLRKKIKNINIKKTVLILSEIDEIVHYRKTYKYISNFNVSDKIIFFNLSHYSALKDGKNLRNFIISEVKKINLNS
ncbi:MAG: hypothetical protein HPPSJP_0430 [Candidatus Hepatoplasma scabrum]|nr:MAG: hypothetical protein HPPSJP_0430 [Candidatus Hepatoplasma sp.]